MGTRSQQSHSVFRASFPDVRTNPGFSLTIKEWALNFHIIFSFIFICLID